MRTSETTDWNVLLGCDNTLQAVADFAFNDVSASATTRALSFTDAAGEFRSLLRSNGTQYARRLARKALRYRGYDVV